MTDVAQSELRPTHDVDISSWTFWSQNFDERDRAFARLRTEPGPTWHPPLEVPYSHQETGLWAATTQEDIAYVSKHPELFSSAAGVSVEPLPPGVVDDTGFFLAMDPPEHTLYRRLVSAAFTPKAVGKLRDKIEADAKDIVRQLVGAGEVDFVSACSAKLPMRTVSDLVGISRERREEVARAAHELFSAYDSEVRKGEDYATFARSKIDFLHAAGIEAAEERRKRPQDDLMTAIVQAEVDGHRLTNAQIGAFMVLLSTAGNDTTKQTTSHTMWALSRFPEQRAWLGEAYEERIGTAIEEFVRFASPVTMFARIALEDTEIRGSRIRAGEKVGLFYNSGNRDEGLFDRPQEFLLTRNPNPHVGFGGGGVHYCLGNQIAKMQLRALFRELLEQVPDAEVGEREILPSRFVHAVKRLPVTFPATTA